MLMVVCSDIHGNQYSFSAFQKKMDELQPDRIIFLGDVFGYYYGQEEILTFLRTSGYNCLLGNHDKFFLDLLEDYQKLDLLCRRYGSGYRYALETVSEENIAFLKTLHPEMTISERGLKIGFFHGSPTDPLNGRIYPDTPVEDISLYQRFDYLFLGHTHHKMIRQLGKTVVVNGGSLGQQRDGKGCSYVVFDTNNFHLSIETVEFDREKLAAEAAMRDPNLASLQEVLYRRYNEQGK